MATDNPDPSREPGAAPETAEAHRAENGPDTKEPIAATLAKARTVAMVGILVLLILYTAYFASTILIPMALAFLLSLVLAPVVGWLKQLHIPYMLGAAMVLAVLVIGFAGGIYGLSTPVAHWIKKAPQVTHKVEHLFQSLNGPLNELHSVTKNVSNDMPGAGPSANKSQPVTVVNQSPDILTRAFSSAPSIVTAVGITIVLLYFLLAAGDSFMRSLAHAVPRWRDKKQAVETARKIQYLVSRYLLTITMINLSLGFVDGIALWAIGLPNPALWGAMIAIFNFVPYIGATVAIIIATFVAFITFNNFGLVILVPCVLIAISILEGQFITPRVVGRRLELSPVAIFVALVVWGWIWGIAGAIMAIPFLACFKIVCEQVEGLNPIAEFLTVYSTHHREPSRDSTDSDNDV